MLETSISDVTAAFEVLIEKLHSRIDSISRIGAKAFEGHDFIQVRQAITQAEKINAFHERLLEIQSEWGSLMSDDHHSKSARPTAQSPASAGTSDKDFYLPMLEALMGMGGSGAAEDVLNRVGEMMKPRLKEADFNPVSGSKGVPLWLNTAQWAKHAMLKEALLGVDDGNMLHITDAGRDLLAQKQNK